MKSPTITPNEVDELCLAFNAEKLSVEAAQRAFSTTKGKLLEAIQSCGYIPSHAEKTTRLEGNLYVADATVATTVEIKETVVNTLQLELSRMKKPRIFSQLFDRKVKHSLRKDAASLLKNAVAALPPDAKSRIHSLFSSCFTVNSKAPAISVDLAASLKAKEAEAAKKAERKAAKKGGAK